MKYLYCEAVDSIIQYLVMHNKWYQYTEQKWQFCSVIPLISVCRLAYIHAQNNLHC